MANETIFFSYSSKDLEFARKLANDLRNIGANIWLDKDDIEAGENWDKAIFDALIKSKIVLLVVSQASMDSDHVLDEVLYAKGKKIRIVPVKIQACELPPRLSRLHYTDFIGSYDKGLETLLKTLNLKTEVKAEPDKKVAVEVVKEKVKPTTKKPAVKKKTTTRKRKKPAVKQTVIPEPTISRGYTALNLDLPGYKTFSDRMKDPVYRAQIQKEIARDDARRKYSIIFIVSFIISFILCMIMGFEGFEGSIIFKGEGGWPVAGNVAIISTVSSLIVILLFRIGTWVLDEWFW